MAGQQSLKLRMKVRALLPEQSSYNNVKSRQNRLYGMPLSAEAATATSASSSPATFEVG